MKYLGLDYGTKRIGIALSDESGEFAFPKMIVETEAKALAVIQSLVVEDGVGAIVLGESIAENGIQNEVFRATLRFKEKLSQVVAVPIILEEEGFSTVEAHRYQVKKGSRDDSAAAIILQRYLDKLPK
ncbi:MAG TPA: Holliday junction resolvase RuvX [Candidatus Paceibacterota bacterium]